MSEINQFYKKITHRFLDRNWIQGFDIYYKTRANNEDKYIFFTHYDPAFHETIASEMNKEDAQDFYVHETDLIRYYKEGLIAPIQEEMERRGASLDLLKRVYTVACKVLQEYFDNMTTNRMLRVLDPVVELMKQNLMDLQAGFTDVFKMTVKENHTYTHCANVGMYCMALGVTFKMNENALRELGLGGMLFDLGKKQVGFDLISKPEKLTPKEFKHIRRHPAAGKKILSDMKCYSQTVLEMAGHHHEKFDGTGYPFGLEGDEIPLHARICSIIDVFDALTSDRSYRPRFAPARALSMMKNDMGGSFDERILKNILQTISPKTRPMPEQASEKASRYPD